MSYFLFIAPDYKPNRGGIAAYIDNLARGLIGIGNKVKILAVARPEEKERIKFLQNYEAWVSPFVMVHDERPKSWLGYKFVSLLEIVRCLWPSARHLLERTSLFQPSSHAIAKLREILMEEKPSMIVFGNLDIKLYPFVLFLLEHKMPYAIIAHDSEIFVQQKKIKINDIIRRGIIIKRARCIAANSRHTRSLLEMWGLSKDNIVIVHPPISDQEIKESTNSDMKIKNEYYNLITICRLVHSKGIDIVLRALKIIEAQDIPYRYVIGGDGNDRKFLEELADELGMKKKVHFMGNIAEDTKRSLLRNADVFVMPSRVNPSVSHEGFGMAFIEAAVFGLPGVGSTGGGIPDAVIHGETGLLVPQESPGKLAEALIYLYKNPEKREEMGKTGMDRARNHFSPTAIASHFQKEFTGRI